MLEGEVGQDTLTNPTPIFVSVEPRFQNSSFS